MNREVIVKATLLVGVVALFFLGGYGLFKATSDTTTNTQNYTDQLSGETVDMTTAVGDAAPNPSMPYFVGFDYLTKYGITNDDLRYIQDTIAHFTVYKKQDIFAKVSFDKDSFTYLDASGTQSHYRFKFGINDNDLYSTEVSSDIVSQKISVKIKQHTNTVYNRSFTLYSL